MIKLGILTTLVLLAGCSNPNEWVVEDTKTNVALDGYLFRSDCIRAKASIIKTNRTYTNSPERLRCVYGNLDTY